MAEAITNRAPGVHLQEVASRPAPVLETGVPVFVGLRRQTPSPALLAFAKQLGLLEAFSGTRRGPIAIGASTWASLDGAFGATWAEGLLGFAVRGFFHNGGRRAHLLLHDAGELTAALESLEVLDDFDILCAPDAAANTLDQVAILDSFRRRPGCFALLDGPGSRLPTLAINASMLVDNADTIRKHLDRHGCMNGSLLGPWIKVPGACPICAGKGCVTCGGTGQGFVPPSGHVAGILCRLDHRIGVHRAPANEPMEGALDVQFALDDATLRDLNATGIVTIRAFPGRGIRPWGARTLAPNDGDFANVNVRRTFLTIARWLELMAAELTFEPNDMRLWLRIERQVSGFLDGLYRRGALLGASAAEAYYIKCDAETNPPIVRDRGMTVAEIGLSIARPNEFITVRLSTGAAGATVTQT